MNHTKTIFFKLISVAFILVAPILFTSCIDYVQTISYKDDMYSLYYKVTLSKELFALDNKDPEDIFGDLNNDVFSDLPDNVETRSVNTDLEIGTEVSLNVNPRTASEAEKSFLPTVAGNKCYFPFLLGSETSNFSDSMKSSSEYESLVTAILASAKCRVMISKSVIAKVEAAYFDGKGRQNYPVAVFDYGESWCMEIPFIALFDDSKYRFDRLVVIKG